MSKSVKTVVLAALSISLAVNAGGENKLGEDLTENSAFSKNRQQIVVAAEKPGPDIGIDTPEEIYSGSTTLLFDLKEKFLRPKTVAVSSGTKYVLQQQGISCKLYNVEKQKKIARVTIGCLSSQAKVATLNITSTYFKKADPAGVVDTTSDPIPKPVVDSWKKIKKTKNGRFSKIRQVTEHKVVLHPSYTTEPGPEVDYAFLSYQTDRQTPVGWNRCKGPISVHVYTKELLDDVFYRTLETVLRDINEQSGLQLQFSGATSFEPQTNNVDDPNVSSDRNLTVAVVDSETNTFFTSQKTENPGVVGWGGAQAVWDKKMWLTYLNGIAVLDKSYIQRKGGIQNLDTFSWGR